METVTTFEARAALLKKSVEKWSFSRFLPYEIFKKVTGMILSGSVFYTTS